MVSHVSNTLMKMLYRAKGAKGICLVTDATAGAGLPEGARFTLAGADCVVSEGACWLADRSALAGSASRMIDLVRTMVRHDVEFRCTKRSRWRARTQRERSEQRQKADSKRARMRILLCCRRTWKSCRRSSRVSGFSLVGTPRCGVRVFEQQADNLRTP